MLSRVENYWTQLKKLRPSQKTLRHLWCPVLVTGVQCMAVQLHENVQPITLNSAELNLNCNLSNPVVDHDRQAVHRVKREDVYSKF